MKNIDTFEEFRYRLSKNSLLIAIFIAVSFEGLRLFDLFPTSKFIMTTTLILIAILFIIYFLMLKKVVKLLYSQLMALILIISYIIFETALVSYHKFLPIWIDFSIIIAYIIMDRRYAFLIGMYSLVGVLFIYLKGFYNVDFFSLFTLLFSILTFSILGYTISLQLSIYEKENKKQKQKLEKLVLIDELTQIFNRRAFFEISNKILKQANREHKKISVLMLDIDFFKKINDTYGHAAGDVVLKSIAQIVQKNIRENDVFARIGGEEFAILLYDVDASRSIIIAYKILESIRKSSIVYKNTPIHITISIGVYCNEFPIDENSKIKDFLFKADQALYKAKKTGRNKVVCY